MTNALTLPRVFLGVLVALVVVSTLLSPGILDLTAPSHSDLYRYFLLSDHRWVVKEWLSPRPFMLAFLKVAGVTGSPWILYCLLALPSMALIVAALEALRRAGGLHLDYTIVALMSSLAFGSPWFYPLFQYDYGGMLSGVFAVISLVFAYRYLNQVGAGGGTALACCLIFAWISIETKPTFSFSFLLILFSISAGILKVPAQTIARARLVFLLLVGIMGFVFLKDRALGSSFINVNSNASPYSLVLDPATNLTALGFYLRKSLTIPLGALVVISWIVLWRVGKWRWAALISAGAVGAVIPMALIPNRLWEIYAWYTTFFWCILIVLAFDSLRNFSNTPIRSTRAARGLAGAALVSIGCIALAHAVTKSSVIEWTYSHHAYNRKILDSLRLSDQAHSGRTLVAGVHGPYHPFKNTRFIERVFPQFGNFDVLLMHSENEWNGMAHEMENGIYFENLDFSIYNRISIYSDDATTPRIVDSKKFLQMPTYERAAALFCGVSDMDDATRVAKAIECLNLVGEPSSAIGLGEAKKSMGQGQPWIFYHLAQAYGTAGDADKKRLYATLALEVEAGNSVFLEAAK